MPMPKLARAVPWMRRTEHDDFGDVCRTMPAQISARSQPAHAVCDQDDPLLAAGCAQRPDGGVERRHVPVDTAADRLQIKRVVRDAGRGQYPAHRFPISAMAAIAVHQQDRQGARRGCRPLTKAAKRHAPGGGEQGGIEFLPEQVAPAAPAELEIRRHGAAIMCCQEKAVGGNAEPQQEQDADAEDQRHCVAPRPQPFRQPCQRQHGG